MAQEKVYRVTAMLDIYGQTSKVGAVDYLLEGLCDGVILVDRGKTELLKEDAPVPAQPQMNKKIKAIQEILMQTGMAEWWRLHEIHKIAFSK